MLTFSLAALFVSSTFVSALPASIRGAAPAPALSTRAFLDLGILADLLGADHVSCPQIIHFW